jgi:hypothetical protein
MPAPELNGRHQKAVLWEKVGLDNYGNPTLDASPVEIVVRWEEGRSESIDDNGNPIGVDAQVIVAQEIPVGSIMWRGALANLPNPPTGLKQVISYNETPDIKGRVTFRKVSLVRYSETLPTTVGT